MADIETEIDALYQGPLDAFTDARNALAKTAKRPDVKALQKPSLAAWVVNQLHWHHRAALDRLGMAAEAVRKEHGKALSGRPADVRAAEQAHREVVRAVLTDARAVLTEGGHPITQATLDAVRDTLQVLPSPEANGRLTRPLAPKGFEALAGFTVAPALRVVPPAARRAPAPADDDDGEAEAEAEAERARARKAAEREARERHKVAEKAVEAARAVLQRADIALDDAERVVKKRRAERDAAAAAHEQAIGALREFE